MNKKFIFPVMQRKTSPLGGARCVLLACILAFCFGFASCSASYLSLVGVWEAIDKNKGTIIDIEFFDNGTVKWGDYGTFVYTVENNQILLTGKNRSISVDYKISGNNLFIALEGQKYWDFYKRKNVGDSSK